MNPLTKKILEAAGKERWLLAPQLAGIPQDFMAIQAAELLVEPTEGKLHVPPGLNSPGLIEKYKDNRPRQLLVAIALATAELEREIRASKSPNRILDLEVGFREPKTIA